MFDFFRYYNEKKKFPGIIHIQITIFLIAALLVIHQKYPILDNFVKDALILFCSYGELVILILQLLIVIISWFSICRSSPDINEKDNLLTSYT